MDKVGYCVFLFESEYDCSSFCVRATRGGGLKRSQAADHPTRLSGQEPCPLFHLFGEAVAICCRSILLSTSWCLLVGLMTAMSHRVTFGR